MSWPVLPTPLRPGVSRTALASLQTHALLELGRPDGLAPALYEVAAAGGRQQLARAADPDAYRTAVRAGELPGPGQVSRFGARKRWMAAAAEHALAAGIRQIAVLGAGFDTLGLRLLRGEPDHLVAELDRPATLAAKEHALHASAIAPPWPRFAAVDLAEPSAVARALENVDWRAADPALFVAEVVLEYLASEAALALLSSIGALAGPASRLACTVRFGDVADDRAAAAAAAAGEPMRFRPATAAELRQLLERAGLDVLAADGVIGTGGASALLVLEARP